MSASTAGRFVGQSVKRREDPRLLTGHGRYVDDVVLPGHVALHVRAQRRCPGADRRASTSSAARALAGVTAVLTAADLNPHAGTMQPTLLLAMPGAPLRPLADGDVRFVGEPIVLIVAESRYVAEDAAELVEVEIDVEPAVIDVERALDDGMPIVHPELGTNLGGEMEFPDLAGARSVAAGRQRRAPDLPAAAPHPGTDGDARDRRRVRTGGRRDARVDEHAESARGQAGDRARDRCARASRARARRTMSAAASGRSSSRHARSSRSRSRRAGSVAR